MNLTNETETQPQSKLTILCDDTDRAPGGFRVRTEQRDSFRHPGQTETVYAFDVQWVVQPSGAAEIRDDVCPGETRTFVISTDNGTGSFEGYVERRTSEPHTPVQPFTRPKSEAPLVAQSDTKVVVTATLVVPYPYTDDATRSDLDGLLDGVPTR